MNQDERPDYYTGIVDARSRVKAFEYVATG